eukprot:8586520-Lingulodinium_polyedra.AAC.1
MDFAPPSAAWFAKVAKDVKKLGGVRHPIDQTVFMFYAREQGSKRDAKAASVASVCIGTSRRLSGALGVYVVDFPLA